MAYTHFQVLHSLISKFVLVDTFQWNFQPWQNDWCYFPPFDLIFRVVHRVLQQIRRKWCCLAWFALVGQFSRGFRKLIGCFELLNRCCILSSFLNQYALLNSWKSSHQFQNLFRLVVWIGRLYLIWISRRKTSFIITIGYYFYWNPSSIDSINFKLFPGNQFYKFHFE